jgi:plastocyanin
MMSVRSPVVVMTLLLGLVTSALAVSLRAAAQGAATGAIRGRVAVPDVPAAPARPAVGDLSGATHPVVDRRRVVVYLESAPRNAFDELRPGLARMDQRGEQFVPRVLAITVGTSVLFPNNDKTFHNVFSLSRVKTFDLGRYRPGRTGRPVRFDRPGIVPVFCDIHTHMSAFILVFGHPFFAVSDTDGRYQIDGVPPGTYSLRVWSELGSVQPRPVTVRDGGTAEVNVQVTRDAP